MALLSPRLTPAALTLHQLTRRGGRDGRECDSLAQSLWGLAREIVPKSVPDAPVLESSRTFFS